ncbi:MAG: hypothetical protein J6K92_06615, partial [Oscillospiraceae bacterium]|nr:hypothetical protein [Oscillospiraceae bacterium]
MIKKLLAFLIAAVTAVSSAACGGGDNKTKENVSVSQSTELTLSNPDATKEAKALYKYICGTYGNGIISGQQESTWMGSEQYEFEYIYEKTGKYPAIRGLDYMNDDFDGVNRRAEEWHKKGGI